MGNTSNTTVQAALQAAIQHMQQEISQIPELLRNEAVIAQQEAPYLAEEQNDIAVVDQNWQCHFTQEDMELNAPNWATFSGSTKRAFHNYYEDEQALTPLQSKMSQAESQILALDPNLGGLLTAFNQLVETTDEVASLGAVTQDTSEQIFSLGKMVKDLSQMIVDRITCHLANKEMNQLGSNALSSPEGQQLQSMINSAMDNEREELHELNKASTRVSLHEGKVKSNAKDNEQTYHWWDGVADYFGAHVGPNIGLDRQIVEQADQILNGLTKLQNALVPFSFIDTGMQTLVFELQILMQKMKEFLEGKCSLQQLKDAMIQAFAIMVEIIAETSKKSSSYEQQMSQGAIQFSQAKLDQSLNEQQVIDSAREYAAIMGKILDVAKYVGLALILVLNPSAAMALMVLLDAVLNATGVMNDLQKAIAKKLGGVAGAIITGVLETAGTVGGAALLEAALARIAIQAVTIASERSVQACIQTTIQETALAGAKDSESSIKETIELAVKTAKDKVVAAFASKSIPQLVYALARGDLKVALQAAQKEAAQNASQQLQLLISADTRFGANEVEEIANRSASKAVAKAMEISDKNAAKLGNQAMKQLVIRTAGMMAASMGSTQMLNHIFEAHHRGEAGKIALEIINMLLQLFGMMGASIGPSIAAEGLGATFTGKFFAATTTIDGTSEGVGQLGEAGASIQEAKAIQEIAKDQAGMDLMHFVLDQLQRDANQERSAYAREIEQLSKSNNQMAVHLNDAETAVARALQAMAV